MKIDKDDIQKILNELESSLGVMRRMDQWLPKTIDDAINGHDGRMDYVDLGKMQKSKMEAEKHYAEINSLREQVENSQKQTLEIAEQTKYIMLTAIATLIGLISSIGFQLWQHFEEKTGDKDTFYRDERSSRARIGDIRIE